MMVITITSLKESGVGGFRGHRVGSCQQEARANEGLRWARTSN